MRYLRLSFATALAVTLSVSLLASPASAHFAGFKSPGPGMHFTQGQPIIVFEDLFDSRDGKGIIVCPSGQTVSNTSPAPDYSDPPRVAQCSGGGTPTGWPRFQLLIDGVPQVDTVANSDTLPNTTAFDHNINPAPIGFFRFSAPSSGLAPGAHQIVARGMFSNDAVNIMTQDSLPMTIYIDAPPAGRTTMTLTSNLTGAVNWNNMIIVGNGHTVAASGSLVIKNSLVTGLGSLSQSGLTGTITDADIEGSIFEDTGAIDVTMGTGAIVIKNNEFRANNRLTFVADNPGVPFMLTLRGGGAGMKVFQGNRVGAGQTSFGGQNWLIGGDTDDLSNIFIGPRTILNVAGSSVTVRGNYSHHNYRGAWSQGFNFYYETAGSNVLTEHNFIRDGSWPVQYLHGEFRYNVVYGFGHSWIRTATAGTSIHHNLFTPGGDAGLAGGIQCYGGESGLLIYNNTFDGGGMANGDFAGPDIDMTGGSQVASFRNNLVTFSRNQQNSSPGGIRITGGSASYLYSDYNSFYSPDNTTKTAYDFTGAGAHDMSGTSAVGVANGQLAATPFAGARINTDANRMIDSVVDEAAIWQGMQKVSSVLALFRARYTPVAGSAIVNTGDPQDNDSQGRRTDIGAIDLDGHDQDKLGKFGMAPAELVPPTVSLTAPAGSAVLTGTATVSATAQDNAGGSGVVLVQFLVDGSVVAQDAASPYTATFNSANVTNGQHMFTAKAWDAAGNSAVSAAITATTTNTVVIPPRPDGGAGASGGAGSSGGVGGGGGSGTAGTGGGGLSAAGGGGGTTTGPDGGAIKERGGPVTGGCGCSTAGADGTTTATTLLLLIAIGGTLLMTRSRTKKARRR